MQASSGPTPRHLKGDVFDVARSLVSDPAGFVEFGEDLILRSYDGDSNVIDSAVLDPMQVRDLTVSLALRGKSGGQESTAVSRRQPEGAVLAPRACSGEECRDTAACLATGCRCFRNTEGRYCL